LGLDPGTYLVHGTADFQAGNNNKSVSVRLYNSNDDIVYGESVQQTNNSSNYFSFAAQGEVSIDGTTNKAISIQYKNDGGTTCFIRNAHIVFWRVK
jgi:hypothetical protein